MTFIDNIYFRASTTRLVLLQPTNIHNSIFSEKAELVWFDPLNRDLDTEFKFMCSQGISFSFVKDRSFYQTNGGGSSALRVRHKSGDPLAVFTQSSSSSSSGEKAEESEKTDEVLFPFPESGEMRVPEGMAIHRIGSSNVSTSKAGNLKLLLQVLQKEARWFTYPEALAEERKKKRGTTKKKNNSKKGVEDSFWDDDEEEEDVLCPPEGLVKPPDSVLQIVSDAADAGDELPHLGEWRVDIVVRFSKVKFSLGRRSGCINFVRHLEY